MILYSDIMKALDYVRNEWGNEVIIKASAVKKTPMTFDSFLNYCTSCGGNWGGMLLSGVRRLYPDVWEAIPDDLGVFAFTTICNLLILLGVDTSEK